MDAVMRLSKSTLLSALLLFSGPIYAITSNEIDNVMEADLSLFEDEILLFRAIGDSILLSVSQCDSDLGCLKTDDNELVLLLEHLTQRIAELLERQEVDDSDQLNDILYAYTSERDNYILYLERLQFLLTVSEYSDNDDAELFKDEGEFVDDDEVDRTEE